MYNRLIHFLSEGPRRKILILLTFGCWVLLFSLLILWGPSFKQKGSSTLLISIHPLQSFSDASGEKEREKLLALQLKMTATFHRRLLENRALLETTPLTVEVEKISDRNFLLHLFLKHEKPVVLLNALLALYFKDYFDKGTEEVKKNLSKIYDELDVLEREIIDQEMMLFQMGELPEKNFKVENLSQYFSSLREIRKKKSEAIQNEEIEYKRAHDEFLVLSQKYKSAHPLIEKSKQQLSQIKSSFQARILKLEREEKELRQKISDIQKRFRPPTGETELPRKLIKSLDINRKMYAELREKAQKILSEGLIQNTDVQVLTPPCIVLPPFFSLSSLIRGILSALLILFTLMIGAFYWIERQRRKEREAKETLKLDLKILGNFRLSPFRKRIGEEIHLLLYQHPDHPLSHEMRRLTNQLTICTRGKNMKSLLITYEGLSSRKINITSNLGVALAHQKKRVLLIDALWNDPHLNDIFYIKNDPGLIDLLLGKMQPRNAIQETEIPGLEILPSGSYLPDFELLSSPFMETLIDQLEPVYDFILIEAPSCLDYYDIFALAHYVQGVILVQNEKEKLKPMTAYHSGLMPEDIEKLSWVGKVSVTL